MAYFINRSFKKKWEKSLGKLSEENIIRSKKNIIKAPTKDQLLDNHYI